jgi:hypothetical protein
MNTTRPLALALLLLCAAGAACADDDSSQAPHHSEYQALRAKLHSLGYHGPVQALGRFQPYPDSTGGTSQAAGDRLDPPAAATVASTRTDTFEADAMSRWSQERDVR